MVCVSAQQSCLFMPAPAHQARNWPPHNCVCIRPPHNCVCMRFSELEFGNFRRGLTLSKTPCHISGKLDRRDLKKQPSTSIAIYITRVYQFLFAPATSSRTSRHPDILNNVRLHSLGSRKKNILNNSLSPKCKMKLDEFTIRWFTFFSGTKPQLLTFQTSHLSQFLPSGVRQIPWGFEKRMLS